MKKKSYFVARLQPSDQYYQASGRHNKAAESYAINGNFKLVIASDSAAISSYALPQSMSFMQCDEIATLPLRTMPRCSSQ